MARGRRSLADTLAASRRPQLAATPQPAPEGEARPQPLTGPDAAIAPSPLAFFNNALVEGDLEAAARHFADAMRERGDEHPPPSAESLRLAEQMARAFARIGRFAPEELLARAPQLTEDDLAALGASRHTGDAAEAAIWRSRDGRAPVASIRSPHDQESFWALARAIVRIPDRFTSRAHPEGAAPRQVNIQVDHRLLCELDAAADAHPGYRGLRLLTGAARRGVSTRPLVAAAEWEAVVDGVPTRICAWHVLGDTKATDAAGRAKSARGMVRRNRPELEPILDRLVDEGRQLGVGALTGPQGAIAPGAPALDAEVMLGADRCDHAGAAWRRNGMFNVGPDAADAVIRSCPDCHRDRVEVLPLHRLATDHHLIRGMEVEGGEEAYLARERFHAELAGDHRRVVSVDQLRRRDGVALRPDPRGGDKEPLVALPDRRVSIGEALGR